MRLLDREEQYLYGTEKKFSLDALEKMNSGLDPLALPEKAKAEVEERAAEPPTLNEALEELKKAQQADAWLKKAFIQASEEPNTSRFEVEDGILYRLNFAPTNSDKTKRTKLVQKKRLAYIAPRALVIPLALQQKFLQAFHNSSTSAHSGVERTYARMRRRFWWEGLDTDVRSWVNACTLCKRRKAIADANAGEAVQIDEPTRPFQFIAI